jgi:hypothetical protein
MKRIYRHYQNHYHFELVTIVPAAKVEAEIERRKAQDAALIAAGWQDSPVYYRVN